MKVGLYTGSFAPFHAGHTDVLQRALQVFDRVIIARGINPDKPQPDDDALFIQQFNGDPRIEVIVYKKLLSDLVKDLRPTAVIRGLRNTQDFEYEKIQEYWYQDLGMAIPIVYFIADRSVTHVSSSAIRTMDKIMKWNDS